jgi:sulfur carrier protein
METTKTNMIEIVLNGEPRAVPAGLSIDRLLTWLEMDAARVAVELNREIVRKPAWPASEILPGAQIEIVWFVGGGAN